MMMMTIFGRGVNADLTFFGLHLYNGQMIKDQSIEAICDKITAKRVRDGLSVDDAARMAKISRQTVRRIESAEPGRVTSLAAYLRVLGYELRAVRVRGMAR